MTSTRDFFINIVLMMVPCVLANLGLGTMTNKHLQLLRLITVNDNEANEPCFLVTNLKEELPPARTPRQ